MKRALIHAIVYLGGYWMSEFAVTSALKVSAKSLVVLISTWFLILLLTLLLKVQLRAMFIVFAFYLITSFLAWFEIFACFPHQRVEHELSHSNVGGMWSVVFVLAPGIFVIFPGVLGVTMLKLKRSFSKRTMIG